MPKKQKATGDYTASVCIPQTPLRSNKIPISVRVLSSSNRDTGLLIEEYQSTSRATPPLSTTLQTTALRHPRGPANSHLPRAGLQGEAGSNDKPITGS
jgi:hypothetical protein